MSSFRRFLQIPNVSRNRRSNEKISQRHRKCRQVCRGLKACAERQQLGSAPAMTRTVFIDKTAISNARWALRGGHNDKSRCHLREVRSSRGATRALLLLIE